MNGDGCWLVSDGDVCSYGVGIDVSVGIACHAPFEKIQVGLLWL